MGKDPDLRLVACSYSATLALQFSRDVQLIMDEPNYARLWPESVIPGIATKHNAAVRQADHFELVRHRGSYRCAGIQGSIAGFPVDVLIVDDPYKDYLEARSLIVRENVWNNFVSVLLPRLQQGGGVLICCTRWHQDDLVGRLLERESDKWRVLSYPALAEEDEPHRAKGEPLSPRFSLESRLEHRDRIGEYLWSALFQRDDVSVSIGLEQHTPIRRDPSMLYVTLTLNENEWQRINGAAQKYWPGVQLNRTLSRNECCRRLLLGGLDSLQAKPRDDQQQMVDSHACSLQPPADHYHAQLPGAPK